jgi:hypothetical protein
MPLPLPPPPPPCTPRRPPPPSSSSQECSDEDFAVWKNNREATVTVEASRLSLVDYLEQTLQQAHQKYFEMATYKDELSRTFYGQVERMHVLNKAGEFFQFESSATAAYQEDAARARDPSLLNEDDLSEGGCGARRAAGRLTRPHPHTPGHTIPEHAGDWGLCVSPDVLRVTRCV